MNNITNNNPNQIPPKEDKTGEIKPGADDNATASDSTQTNQAPEVKSEKKTPTNNFLNPKEDGGNKNREGKDGSRVDNAPNSRKPGLTPPEETAKEKKEFLIDDELPVVSEAELPHQPNAIRPEDIVEIEQEPPKEIITDKDIEKAKEIESVVSTLPAPDEERLESPPEEERLGPLTPAKKKKILPKTMNSSEVVACLKDLRTRLNELLVKANEARVTNSEKNLEKIMEYARRTQKVTNNDVERITGVQDRQAGRYLKKLVKNKKLARFGRYKYTFYKPIKN